MFIMVQIIGFGVVGGCATTDDGINGYYKYEETIYRNPVSSYLVTKDNADDYIIADDSVTIVHTDGTREQILTSLNKSEVDEEAFVALFQFQPEIGVPDISVFKQRHTPVKFVFLLNKRIDGLLHPPPGQINTIQCLYQVPEIGFDLIRPQMIHVVEVHLPDGH